MISFFSATPAVPEEGGDRERDREGGERKRRRRDRERSREREAEPVTKDKRSRSPDSSIESAGLQSGPGAATGGGIDHEFEEMKWGLNMALIGEKCWYRVFHIFGRYYGRPCILSEQ